jgi:hypothetical protein
MSVQEYTDDMLKDVAKLLAKHFIARSDVMAQQHPDGGYSPTRGPRNPDGTPGDLAGFSMPALMNHLKGTATLGHYLLNKDNQCKLFAFDIDIDGIKSGTPKEDWCLLPTSYIDGEYREYFHIDGRLAWKTDMAGFQLDGGPTYTRDMQIVSRDFLRYQLRRVADELMIAIRENLEIPTVFAYTGNKGLHVYGFTGLMDAKDVREGAEICAEAARMRPHKGSNFWKPTDNFAEPCALTVEIFPKQTTIGEDGFGNLLRLPLGKNLKNPEHPTFFCSDVPGGERSSITPVDTLQLFETVFRGL